MKKVLVSIAFFALMLTSLHATDTVVSDEATQSGYQSQSIGKLVNNFWETTGLKSLISPSSEVVDSNGKQISFFAQTGGKIIMFAICLTLFYLAIKKGFEPLLLIPIAFGGLLANIPIANIGGPDGFIGILYSVGITTTLFPILIFMGVGAMTDFGPLLSNPKTAILGGAAQFGIFGSLVGAAMLSHYTGIVNFSIEQASAISIIGGADGPTSIFIASALAPELLGAIAIAAYTYMALVPVIQPPIMRVLTTKAERQIKMQTLRKVHKLEKLLFPLVVLFLTILVLPTAAPLIGAFCFGNFVKESGVVERLNDTLQNALINIVTIFLGLAVGTTMVAEKFLVPETLGIMVIGIVAFAMGTAMGVIMAKIMNLFSKEKINPLIGAAGVSAVPMSARVVNKVGMEEKPGNVLLMHAMGPNVAGVIGSAVAAGVLISIFM